MDIPDADNVILHIYPWLKPDQMERLGAPDIQLLQRLFKKRTGETNYSISTSLITLMKLDLSLFNELAPEYLGACSTNDMSNLASFFLIQPEGYFDNSAQLLLEHTIRFDITEKLERFLAQIIVKKGFSEVFQYLKRRFETAVARWGAQESSILYEFVPIPIHSHILQQVSSDDQKNDVYLTCLDWYLDGTFDEVGLYLAPKLLDYVKAESVLNPLLEKAYKERLSARGTDGVIVFRLVSSLYIFTDKNEALIDLVCQIRRLSRSSFRGDTDLLQQIDYQCSHAISHFGTIITKGYEPFEGHVSLKALLEKAVLRYKNEPDTKVFLNQQLANVDKSIGIQNSRSGISW